MTTRRFETEACGYEGCERCADLADLLAQRDQARRIAASLEADLARILDAWDDAYREGWRSPWEIEGVRQAIAAAREWVGTEAGAGPALDRIIDRYTLAEGLAPDADTGAAS